MQEQPSFEPMSVHGGPQHDAAPGTTNFYLSSSADTLQEPM